MATVVDVSREYVFYYVTLAEAAGVWTQERKLTVEVDPPRVRKEYWGLREARPARLP